MNNEWYTPDWLFEDLNKYYGPFTLDPCASHEHHLCEKYYSKEDNGLSKDWTGEIVFMNPPYDRSIYDWVKKACESKCFVVCLLPAKTDTRWFHDFVLPYAKCISFMRGRLKFSNSHNSAPFPSMVVIFE